MSFILISVLPEFRTMIRASFMAVMIIVVDGSFGDVGDGLKPPTKRFLPGCRANMGDLFVQKSKKLSYKLPLPNGGGHWHLLPVLRKLDRCYS